MRLQLTTKDRARFEKFVDRSGGPDACHPWVGHCHPSGYGRFHVGGKHGPVEQAHRIAWVLAGNEITEEKPCILHDCPDGDLPACCNERHLWAGAQIENCRDMAAKGRGRKSKNGLPFGVFKRRNGRFGTQVSTNGKVIHLGTYDTAEEASAIALARKMRS